jgi:hypothetical protein
LQTLSHFLSHYFTHNGGWSDTVDIFYHNEDLRFFERREKRKKSDESSSVDDDVDESKNKIRFVVRVDECDECECD